MRAALSGANVLTLIEKDIRTPNGLAIDHRAEKLYFSDATLDKIERCEYDGSHRYVSLQGGQAGSTGGGQGQGTASLPSHRAPEKQVCLAVGRTGRDKESHWVLALDSPHEPCQSLVSSSVRQGKWQDASTGSSYSVVSQALLSLPPTQRQRQIRGLSHTVTVKLRSP